MVNSGFAEELSIFGSNRTSSGFRRTRERLILIRRALAAPPLLQLVAWGLYHFLLHNTVGRIKIVFVYLILEADLSNDWVRRDGSSFMFMCFSLYQFQAVGNGLLNFLRPRFLIALQYHEGKNDHVYSKLVYLADASPKISMLFFLLPFGIVLGQRWYACQPCFSNL